MFFRQIKRNGDNFSYIIADEATREAAVVDPSFNADELMKELKVEGFSLKYIVCTHGHSDHTAGNYQLQSALGGQVVAHSLSRIRADLKVEDGDVLKVGQIELKAIYTPGHTTDGICLLVDGKKLLTGDTLFVGECGRVDMPGGSSFKLYDSLFNKILKLDDAVEVYPGHDYGSKPSSTVGGERVSNYVLQPRSVDEFVEFMGQP
jgi:hydroxyacylglutathione hydrolase